MSTKSKKNDYIELAGKLADEAQNLTDDPKVGMAAFIRCIVTLANRMGMERQELIEAIEDEHLGCVLDELYGPQAKLDPIIM